jgi:YD repeat-containing protein
MVSVTSRRALGTRTETDPLNNVWQSSYDAAGQLTQLVDAKKPGDDDDL